MTPEKQPLGGSADEESMRLLAFLACSSLVVTVAASARADEPPPSQSLDSDRATPRAVFEAMAVVRAPFDRSYGVMFGYSPVRGLALESRLAIREDVSFELAFGLVGYPFGRTYDGLLLRASPAAVFAEDGQTRATGFRLDLEAGYAVGTGNFLVEFDAGASYRRAGVYRGGAAWAVSLGLRVGIAY